MHPRNSKIQLILSIDQGHPEETKPEYSATQQTIEQKVRDAILMVDSGHESRLEWAYLEKVYNKLCMMKPTKRVQNLIETIHPVLAKYGKIDSMPNDQEGRKNRREKV